MSLQQREQLQASRPPVQFPSAPMRAEEVLQPLAVVAGVATGHLLHLPTPRRRHRQLGGAALLAMPKLKVVKTTTTIGRCPSLATAQAAWQAISRAPSALGSWMSQTIVIDEDSEDPRMPMAKMQQREGWQLMTTKLRRPPRLRLPLQLQRRWIATATAATLI